MQPTYFVPIGLVLVALILLSKRKLMWSFCLLMGSLLLGGSAFINLPALGGSSMLMAHFAFGVLLIMTFAAAPSRALGEAASRHVAGILLIVYCLVIGYFGPRLFSGIRVITLDGQSVVSLAPTNGNITQTAYFCGTIVLAWVCTVLFRGALTFQHLRAAALTVAALGVFFACLDVLLRTAGIAGPLDFLRNANYVMAEHNIGDVKRASGTFPEPASYAGFAVPLMFFAGELWLQKRDRTAGWIAIASAAGIVMSMSSAGLFAVAAYVMIMVVRLAAALGSPAVFARLMAVLGVVGVGVALTAMFLTAFPDALSSFTFALEEMTIRKGSGDSANQRSLWAMQGVEMFGDSMGFGVGAGSFRSSSVFTAILGSFGLIGAALAALYLFPVVVALMRRGPEHVNGRVAAWAALGALVPQALVAPGPDLGFMYAVFAGYAMAQGRLARLAKPPVGAGATA